MAQKWQSQDCFPTCHAGFPSNEDGRRGWRRQADWVAVCSEERQTIRIWLVGGPGDWGGLLPGGESWVLQVAVHLFYSGVVQSDSSEGGTPTWREKPLSLKRRGCSVNDGVTLFSRLHNLLQFTARLPMKDPVCYSNNPSKMGRKEHSSPNAPQLHSAVLSWVDLSFSSISHPTECPDCNGWPSRCGDVNLIAQVKGME